jgi:hypothetical protein
MTTIDRTQIIETLEDAGLSEDDIRDDYSGRGMYGRECFGFVGSDRDLIRFVVGLARVTDEDYDWLANVCTDNMGLSTIYYWPGVKLSEDFDASSIEADPQNAQRKGA